MVNTRTAYEKLQGVTTPYASWIQNKLRRLGIVNFKVRYSTINRRKSSIFVSEEDWERILNGVNAV